MTTEQILATCERIERLHDSCANPGATLDHLRVVRSEYVKFGPAAARAIKVAVDALEQITGPYQTNGVARRAIIAIGSELEKSERHRTSGSRCKN